MTIETKRGFEELVIRSPKDLPGAADTELEHKVKGVEIKEIIANYKCRTEESLLDGSIK